MRIIKCDFCKRNIGQSASNPVYEIEIHITKLEGKLPLIQTPKKFDLCRTCNSSFAQHIEQKRQGLEIGAIVAD